MNAQTPVKDDPELERLYAQARQYDLLSREQEEQIDEGKWAAINRILEALIDDPFSRHYLARWSRQCLEPLPEIEQFSDRNHRVLLRRELSDYVPGGPLAEKMQEFALQFGAPYCGHTLLEKLTQLSLPGSLVVGIAEVVMDGERPRKGSSVAAALRAWERFWAPEYADVSAPGTTTKALIAAEIERYTAARDLLVTHNLRLVFTIAGRNRNKGVAFLDLIQEGNLGLLRAAEKFRFERGNRFSTYAFNWITQGVKRTIANAAGTIRYPTNVQIQLGKVHGERSRMQANLGRAPVDTELAEALGLSVSRTRELLQLHSLGISLDTPRFEEEPGTSLLDATPGGPFGTPDEASEQTSLHNRLLDELDKLKPEEKRVVIQRWGLQQGVALTRAEIAEQLSVSKEWVRQLERSALQKLAQSDVVKAVYRDHAAPVPRQTQVEN